jgi:hypothetical protein
MELPIIYSDDANSVAAEAQDASGSGAAAAACAAGAAPSNTAPANSTGRLSRILRVGIDSLYVSFQGTLQRDWDARLKARKGFAKSDIESERLQAQMDIGGHRFEVLDRGRGRAAYVLADNWFTISLAASTATSVPVAYVKISNEALVLEGLTRVLQALLVVLNSIAVIESGPHISRIDVCADFIPFLDLRLFDCEHWVTRAQDFAKRFNQREFSGWSIGLGGVVSARLYNKTLELRKSRKLYMHEVWKACGFEGAEDVWRLEFEIKREAIVELGMDTTVDLAKRLESIWLYCTKKWLRLAIPSESDRTSSRSPEHPLWTELSSAWSPGEREPPATRARKDRLPADERLFVHGLGGITSFMASRGITDLGEGFGEFLAQATEFHDGDRRFANYVKRKVLKKGLRFNTIKTHTPTAEELELRREGAARYRKARDGD